MITCREIFDALDEYVAGEMSAARRAVFDQHLAACPDCVEYLESYRRTIQLGKAAFVGGAAPAGVPEGLVRAVLAAARKS